METEKGSLKIKRCSTPNSLIGNKKGDISVALCTLAPLLELELSFSLGSDANTNNPKTKRVKSDLN